MTREGEGCIVALGAALVTFAIAVLAFVGLVEVLRWAL